MSRRIFTIAALAAAALLAPGTAQAQNPMKIGISVGPSFPISDLKDFEDWGYNVAASIAAKPMMSPVGFRIEGMYQNLTGKNNVIVGGITADAPDHRTYAGTANVELAVPTMGVSPYLIGGVGYYGTKFDQSGEKTSNDFGWNLGGGLNFNLAGFSTFLEARFHQVQSKDSNTGTPNLRFVPVSFGLRF